MRIAVLIIALCLTLVVGLQSCAVTMGGSLASKETVSAAGAVGLLVALLFAFGAAFVMGFPKLSAGIFAFAALLAFGFAGEFPDLKVWGFVALGLTVLSFLGSRELKKKAAEKS